MTNIKEVRYTSDVTYSQTHRNYCWTVYDTGFLVNYGRSNSREGAMHECTRFIATLSKSAPLPMLGRNR